MVRKVLPALLLAFTVITGCAVHEARKDHDLIRSTLLDLYTNQILDNLVRAANGLPIIQLDYTNAAATVTITSTIGGSDNQAVTASNVLSLPAATLAATRSIVTTLAGNVGGTNSNQIAIAASPVITSNDVYDAYIMYLDPLKNPGGLMVTCDPPPPCTEPLCKKFNGRYYWVPVEKRKEFFALALATTAQRGKALQAPDSFYTVTLNSPTSTENEPTFLGGGKLLTFNIDKQKIPIDTAGYLVLDKDPTQFRVQTYAGAPPKDAAGAATNATGPAAAGPAMATTLAVTVPFDPMSLQLDKDGKNVPRGNKNLLYISSVNNKLRFLFFDAEGKTFDYHEDTLTAPDEVTELARLVPALDKLWGKQLTGLFQHQVIESAEKICHYVPTSKVDLFNAVQQTGKLYLEHNAPKAPTTQDSLDRMNFLLQQIQLNQNRGPNL